MGDAFGDGSADEQPLHKVCLSAFQMDAYDTTNADYARCVQVGACYPAHYNDGSCFAWNGTAWVQDTAIDSVFRGTDKPVVCVVWQQAVDYCHWVGGRLPTEAEWAYAARGGSQQTRFPNGQTVDCSEANYFANTEFSYDTEGQTRKCVGHTTDVGSYPANGYGLYDMAGNVWQFVSDWYGADYYALSSTQDPQGPTHGLAHAMRGGAWAVGPENVRVARRGRGAQLAVDEGTVTGFRCVRDVRQ